MKTAVFSLVVAICVAVLSLFQFEKYQKLSQETDITLSKLENEVNSKIEELDNSIRLLKGQDQAILTRLKVNTWGNAEIDYLVNLASTELNTRRDAQSAIQLLTKARTKIQQLNDPALEPLQAAIQNDLDNLKNYSAPDRRMLWMRISTLINEASRLTPQASRMKHRQSQQPPQNTSSEPKNWKTSIKEGLEELKGLVKVQRHSKPVEPILPETEQVLVRENLRLLLEQVRLAVLSGDNDVFYQSLQESHDWLSSYYEDTQINVRNLQHAIYAMSKMNLDPPVPSITAIEYLKDLREAR